MSRMKPRAKLLANLLGIRSGAAAVISVSTLDAMYRQHILFRKGTASPLGFRPSYWSYYSDTPGIVQTAGLQSDYGARLLSSPRTGYASPLFQAPAPSR